MNDRRTTPDPELIELDELAQVTVPVADINCRPDGPRDRQILFGDRVTILNRKESVALVRASKDGYCGWVLASALGDVTPATHRVTARSTHAYSKPDIKSPERISLSFGSILTATDETPTFIKTNWGFIPRQHVHTADTTAIDPAAVAEVFLGTPYLWGGNSTFGIDCSGLLQAACLSCGIPCAGDTDQQENTVGTALPEGSPLNRNDVIFWKGHVAVICDAKTIIHANAGHMATVFEPISDAIARIEAQGDGLPTGYRRLL